MTKTQATIENALMELLPTDRHVVALAALVVISQESTILDYQALATAVQELDPGCSWEQAHDYVLYFQMHGMLSLTVGKAPYNTHFFQLSQEVFERVN